MVHGRRGPPRVEVAFSADGGRRFAAPVVVAEGHVKGRVDAVLLDDGAAVSWLGSAGNRGQVQARSVRADSTLSPPVTFATLPAASRCAGFPKLARRGDQLYGSWVEKDAPSSPPTVPVARVRRSDLPR